MVLYLGKSFIEGLLLGNALVPVLAAVGTKAVTSGVNAVIAWWYPCRCTRLCGWR